MPGGLGHNEIVNKFNGMTQYEKGQITQSAFFLCTMAISLS